MDLLLNGPVDPEADKNFLYHIFRGTFIFNHLENKNAKPKVVAHKKLIITGIIVPFDPCN